MMGTYKWLNVPKPYNYKNMGYKEIQHIYCSLVECQTLCDSCIFSIGNIEQFKEWHKINGLSYKDVESTQVQK